MPRHQDPLVMDHPPESIGSSTTDELDFFSNSSQAGPMTNCVSYDVDPTCGLAARGELHRAATYHHDYAGRTSISDTDLPRLEGISLQSPTKNTSVSQPASPPQPPPKATAQKSNNKFIEAVSSTIRKATNRRKAKKPVPLERPVSPTMDMPLKPARQRPRQGTATQNLMPVSSPAQPGTSVNGKFIHGYCDDPFNEMPAPAQPGPVRFYPQHEISPPLSSPGIKSEPGTYQRDHLSQHITPEIPWAQQPVSMPPSSQWNNAEFVNEPDNGWWDFSLLQQQNGEFADQKNAELNMNMHSQQGELPYEYQQLPDTSSGGLLIHIPQPRPPQPTVVNDLSLNVHTQLPPPPPPPPPGVSKQCHRPPRAPSSGARHLSTSPVRKQRAPSASPTRTPSQSHQQSRQSSGGSIGSVRSTSGRMPASMPGTPCSVRKRRSRDASAGGGSVGGSGSASGSLDVGFVNFTPHDGSMLMTGVAPSGSSKTKARREKEASERRRRLSEAAIKAVAAAGGDVDKFIEQGFKF